MAPSNEVPQSLLLWPDGAPGAMDDAPADKPKITPFLPGSGKPTAAVVVCPGGGYRNLAPHESEPIAEWIRSLGIAAILLQYRIAPYCQPAMQQDAQRAIRMVRAMAGRWNIDPRQVGILGFSAGGHLTALTGTRFDTGDPNATDPVERQSSRPDAMILCYPVINPGPYGNEGPLSAAAPSTGDKNANYLNIVDHVSEQTPPAFIWHTSNDQMVDVRNSLLLGMALREHKVPFELHVFPDGRHGLGMAQQQPTVAQWCGLCATWLKDLGWRE